MGKLILKIMKNLKRITKENISEAKNRVVIYYNSMDKYTGMICFDICSGYWNVCHKNEPCRFGWGFKTQEEVIINLLSKHTFMPTLYVL